MTRTIEIPERQGAAANNPDGRIIRKIGNTEYEVNVFFSKTNGETMNDKIKRMLKSETAV
jgi:hypothetical protein